MSAPLQQYADTSDAAEVTIMLHSSRSRLVNSSQGTAVLHMQSILAATDYLPMAFI